MINLYLCAQTINNTMKRNLLLFSIVLNFCFCGTLQLVASDTIFVRETQIPILIERQDNVLFMLRLDAKESRSLEKVVLNFGKDVNLSDIKSVKLYYSGTEARQNYGKKFFAPVTYVSSHAPGKTLAANPSYSINKSQVNNPGQKVTLAANQKLFPGINYFWVSLQMKPDASLLDKISAEITSIRVDGKEAL